MRSCGCHEPVFSSLVSWEHVECVVNVEMARENAVLPDKKKVIVFRKCSTLLGGGGCC